MRMTATTKATTTAALVIWPCETAQHSPCHHSRFKETIAKHKERPEVGIITGTVRKVHGVSRVELLNPRSRVNLVHGVEFEHTGRLPATFCDVDRGKSLSEARDCVVASHSCVPLRPTFGGLLTKVTCSNQRKLINDQSYLCNSNNNIFLLKHRSLIYTF